MQFTKDNLNTIKRYCISLTGDLDSADDLMQTGIEHYLGSDKVRDNQWQKFNNPRAYLYRIIHNAFIDNYRRQKGRYFEPLSDLNDTTADNILYSGFQALDDIIIDKEEVELILEQLSPEHRELLFLWAIEGYTVQEVSDILSVPRGTLLSQLHRMRQKIKSSLASDQSPSQAKEARG
jgi:RNA polymerase sigma-70 factor (ECF subfamily)